MQTANQGPPQAKGSNGKGSLTEAAERAMALRMQAASRASQNSGGGASSNNNAEGSGRASVIKSELAPQGRAVEEPPNNQGGSFYSAPVFPGQMSGSHATPYHAAAQQFQQNSQEDFVDGSNQGGGEIAGQYAAPPKGLPGFADFRRQLGYANNSGYSEYPESMSAAGQYPPPNQMPAMPGNYPSGMMPPAGFIPNTGKEMPGGYDSGASMPVYPEMKMPVFPGMSSHQGPGGMSVAAQGMGQGRDMQPPPQFDTMLQFQPLGS